MYLIVSVEHDKPFLTNDKTHFENIETYYVFEIPEGPVNVHFEGVVTEVEVRD